MKPKEVPTVKVKFTNNKCEPKKGDNLKDLELSNNVPSKWDEKVSKVITKHDKNHQKFLNILDKCDEKRNMIIDNPSNSSIDILVVLSQIIVKVLYLNC